MRESDDIDVQVYRSVLDALARTTLPSPEAGAAGVPVTGRTEAELVRDALLEALGRLGNEDRRVVVLRFAAGLDEQQVGELLDLPADAVEARTAAALTHLDLPAVWEAARVSTAQDPAGRAAGWPGRSSGSRAPEST